MVPQLNSLKFIKTRLLRYYGTCSYNRSMQNDLFNLRRFLNILHTQSTKTPEIALSIDAEKAFDRVEWDYLLYTLHKFGFGHKFISWLRLLYSTTLARVRTNSFYSPYFSLQRGTRQGCCVSPRIALSIKPSATKLRAENQIKGIFRAGQEHKLSLYADDLLLYIFDPLISLPYVSYHF